MSEGNGYATKAALEAKRNKRRFKEFDWGDIGLVVLQSATAGEFVKIDAARQRATLAAMSGKVKEHEQATKDFLLQVCYSLVLDRDSNPFFSPADRELILSLDSTITDPLVTACMDHCSQDTANMGDAQKK